MDTVERGVSDARSLSTGSPFRLRRGGNASKRLARAAGLAATALSASAFAAFIQLDEPVEGYTRACAQSVCATSTTATVTGSIGGTASQADIVNQIPPQFQQLINLVDLHNYQTSQTIGVDLVNSGGTVLNTLVVDFAISQLAYSAGFTFSSDAGGPLSNGAFTDVLATGSYQDVTSALQSQLDLSGVPFPFGTIADFLRASFFPVSVAARSGPLEIPGAQVPLPATGWLFGIGLAALLARGRVQRRTRAVGPR